MRRYWYIMLTSPKRTFLYFLIDAEMYNLDILQRLKCKVYFIFLAKNVKIFTNLLYQDISINVFLKRFRFLDPLTYPFYSKYKKI